MPPHHVVEAASGDAGIRRRLDDPDEIEPRSANA